MERGSAIEVYLMADNSDVVEALRRLVSSEMDTVPYSHTLPSTAANGGIRMHILPINI